MIKDLFKKRRLNQAKHKTNNMMSAKNDSVVISLKGPSGLYEEYFDWLEEKYPDYNHKINSFDGMTYVYMKKK